jgi:hypothetical protein
MHHQRPTEAVLGKRHSRPPEPAEQDRVERMASLFRFSRSLLLLPPLWQGRGRRVLGIRD